MRRFAWLLTVTTVALAGCTHSDSERAGQASSTPNGESMTASHSGPAVASAISRGACPRTGRWALCSVERRLEQSGFVVRRVNGEASRRAGFSVTPTAYTLGRSRLEVFIYPNESALAADVAKIDTASAGPSGARNQWSMPPTFVRSGNLAAIFLTNNATQAERLTLALTAGAPQP